MCRVWRTDQHAELMYLLLILWANNRNGVLHLIGRIWIESTTVSNQIARTQLILLNVMGWKHTNSFARQFDERVQIFIKRRFQISTLTITFDFN